MKPQPRPRFVHPNAYPVHSMSSLGHIGAKSTRCPSPIGPLSAANIPTSSGNGASFASDFSSATAADSTSGARDRRGGKMAGGSLICTSRTAAERCFQQKQQQKHRLQYDRYNGGLVINGKAERPRELEGFEGFEGFPAVEHRMRNSAAPNGTHGIRRSGAAPEAFGDHVPPRPPPMLSMEQQRELKQIQRQQQRQQQQRRHELYLQDRPVLVGAGQHQHQHHDCNGNHFGVEGSEGSVKGFTLLPSLLPSPSRSSLMPALHQHELQGPLTPRDQRAWQSASGGHHHGVLPVPRFASIMPAAPSPHSATAMLQVPIFSSLSEALHHQREQQKRQAQAGQLQNDPNLHRLPHPTTNSLIHAQPSMGGGVCISSASCTTPRQMSDSAGAAHAMPNGQQPTRQGQRHRACGPSAAVEQSRRNEQQRDRGVGGGSFGSAGNGYEVDELCSPGGLVASQMQPLRVPPGISVSMAAPVSGTSSASVSPVMMYAYPHGYVMAYPPLQVQTPRTPHSTASQVQVPQQQQQQQYQDQDQAWNPYECVSPSGESCKGFGNANRASDNSVKGNREKKEAPALKTVNTVKTVKSVGATASREDSPSLSSTLSSGDTSKDDLDTDLSPDSKVEDDTTQESRPRKSRSTPRDPQPPQQNQEQAPTEVDSHDRESVFKTPRRMREAVNSNSRNTEGVPSEDDKENVYCNTNGGFDSRKAVGACDTLEEQLLGKKRGGDEIAKQKSFTGSYFQVSPTSFLQPSKRQRNTFSRE